MRKLIIFICVLLAGGALYALVPNLFPDTPSFPRTPTAEGTVGGVLEKIVGGIISDATDGTVANTAKLDGVTATGYLKNTACGITERWVRIDADGKAVCDSVNPILADYGTVSEQGCDADIYHASGSTSKTSTGKILKAGDIVKTLDNPNCTLTIAFADLSIMRLDADTTVSLDILAPAAPSTQTIASAILSNGSLWGRILTDTGSYSIGTDKIVAGVRGTSIAVTSTGNMINITSSSPSSGRAWTINTTPGSSDTEVAIVDSVMPTGSATVYCRNTNSVATTLAPMSPENIYRVSPTGCSAPPNLTPNSASTLYGRSAWIRNNTLADVNYLDKLIKTVGILSSTRVAKVQLELDSSLPPVGSLEESAICDSGKIFWRSLIGTPQEACQTTATVAFADYSKKDIQGNVDKALYFKDGIVTPLPAPTIPYGGNYDLSARMLTLMGTAVNTTGLPCIGTDQYILYANGPSAAPQQKYKIYQKPSPCTLTKLEGPTGMMWNGYISNVVGITTVSMGWTSITASPQSAQSGYKISFER